MTQNFHAFSKKLSFYTAKKTSTANLQRKAETRTKIQLGGLLIKSGLADLFSIEIGSDLQLDVDEKEKATLLLGALIDMQNNISLNESQKAKWALLGQSAFAEHFLMTKESFKEEKNIRK